VVFRDSTNHDTIIALAAVSLVTEIAVESAIVALAEAEVSVFVTTLNIVVEETVVVVKITFSAA
jgi:hypothetical protein